MKSKIKDLVTHSHKEVNFNLETHTFDIWIFRPDNYSSKTSIEQNIWTGSAGMLFNIS